MCGADGALEERGFSDARLATENEGPAEPATGGVEQGVERRSLVNSIDEDAAACGSGCFGRACRGLQDAQDALLFSIVRHVRRPSPKERLTISMIRSVLAIPTVAAMDEAPVWIHLPIAEAERLSPNLEMPRYCEALRCQSERPTATTFHALITGHGRAHSIWVACADCTGLMLEGAYAT
jgi:hypothetical protein